MREGGAVAGQRACHVMLPCIDFCNHRGGPKTVPQYRAGADVFVLNAPADVKRGGQVLISYGELSVRKLSGGRLTRPVAMDESTPYVCFSWRSSQSTLLHGSECVAVCVLGGGMCGRP